MRDPPHPENRAPCVDVPAQGRRAHAGGHHEHFSGRRAANMMRFAERSGQFASQLAPDRQREPGRAGVGPIVEHGESEGPARRSSALCVSRMGEEANARQPAARNARAVAPPAPMARCVADKQPCSRRSMDASFRCPRARGCGSATRRDRRAGTWPSRA